MLVKRPNALALALVTLVSVVALPLAADEVGTVVFIEGFPDVVREGITVTQDVDFGFRVENFDSVATDATSSLEIEFDASTGIDATVSVEPETQFSIDLSSLAREQNGAVDLVAGTINVVARALEGDSRFQVRTSSAAMGVRGTTFAVSTGPAGEILVSTEEGLVEVTDPDGRSLFAAPGEAVEVDEERSLFQTVRYDRERVGAFRAEWRTRRAELFAERAPEILRFHADRYRRARETFIEAYGSLMRRRAIIDRWMDQNRRDAAPSSRAREEAADLLEDVARVRAAMVRFETAFSRLERMAPFVRELAPDVELENGISAADLYRRLASDRRIMNERFATVRHVLKLYARRSGGRAPYEYLDRIERRREER
ncbi:MAG: FecR family protein [Spirochaetota bacterium]